MKNEGYRMTWWDHNLCEYEGIIKNKKIYFALLAHKDEEALRTQIQNIRHFVPEAGIIIYNGGTNPAFGKQYDVLVYPGSHPIRYGNLTPYFWEVMKWLEHNRVEYQYLINLDHDVLFLKQGFQDFLDKTMENYDVMGWDMVASSSPSDAKITCCREMWKEWDKWGPFFRTPSFLRYLNSTQVYKHGIVKRMLETDHRKVEELINRSKVFALEEIFFVTLAMSKQARIRDYPRDKYWKKASRFRGQISLEEAQWAMKQPHYYWIHPVKYERLIEFHNWLMNDLNRAAQPAPQPGLIEAPLPRKEVPMVSAPAASANFRKGTRRKILKVKRKKNTAKKIGIPRMKKTTNPVKAPLQASKFGGIRRTTIKRPLLKPRLAPSKTFQKSKQGYKRPQTAAKKKVIFQRRAVKRAA